MPSKLEELMDKRKAAEEKASIRAARDSIAKEKRGERARISYTKREFKKLFAKLQTLVDGKWDKFGWGWTFRFKDHDYWISYDHWSSPKTPGDADDYDMAGYQWVLKSHFNASYKDTFILYEDSDDTKKDLTEQVLEGLKALRKR